MDVSSLFLAAPLSPFEGERAVDRGYSSMPQGIDFMMCFSLRSPCRRERRSRSGAAKAEKNGPLICKFADP